MKRVLPASAFLTLAFSILLAGCENSTSPGASKPPRLPTNPDPSQIWDPSGLADFSFTDRTGKTISKQDLIGRQWLAGFIFTRCMGPCPRVTAQMKRLHEQTGVQLVSFTVDPEFDTEEVLSDYAKAYSGLEPGQEDEWYFLTGDQTEIYTLIGKSFLLPVQEMVGEDRKPGFEVLHSVDIMHVDETGRVIGKYNALKDEEMAKLRRILQGKDGSRAGRAAGKEAGDA